MRERGRRDQPLLCQRVLSVGSGARVCAQQLVNLVASLCCPQLLQVSGVGERAQRMIVVKGDSGGGQ